MDVKIEFDSPRVFKQVKKSYWLGTSDEPDLQLPVDLTQLHIEETPDGARVVAVTVPQFIAEDRGLLFSEESDDTTTNSEAMSRDDLYLLGITMAMLVVLADADKATWEARKIVDKLLNQ